VPPITRVSAQCSLDKPRHTYSNPKLDNVAAARAPHGSRRCRPQCRHRDPGMNPARQQAVSTEQCRDTRRTRRACRMVRSAPDSSSSRTISTFPLAAAKCSGVAPDLKEPDGARQHPRTSSVPFDTYLLRALTLARASISSLATRVSECECAVRWSSVNLGLSSSVESTTTLTEAPRSISARTRNGRSFCTALMRQSSRVATLAAAHVAHIPNRVNPSARG